MKSDHNQNSPVTNTAKKKLPESNCETCQFYDYDDDAEAYVCTAPLDQDDMGDFMGRQTHRCPYYRFYDEYKSVHKQI